MNIFRKALDPGWNRKLRSLYVSTEGRMKTAIAHTLQTARDGVKLTDLATAVESGKLADVIDATKIDDLFMATDPIQQEIETAMQAAADFDLAEIKTATGKVINPIGARLKRQLERQTAKRIVAIDETTRETVTRIMTDALKTGRHPYNTAVEIRRHIGLTPKMSEAASRYEAGLVAQGLPPEQVQRQVNNYVNRLLDARAENIARTETMQAINGARQEMRASLVEQGVLPPDQTHTWRTARDERVCPVCGPLDGVSVKLGDTFPGADTDAPPAHPQCRCIVTLDELGEAE